jgi:hypothetical protein
MIVSDSVAADLAAAFARGRGQAGFTADELQMVLERAGVAFVAAAAFGMAVDGRCNFDVQDGAVEFHANELPAAEPLAKSAADSYRNWRALWNDVPVMTWFRDRFISDAKQGMALVGADPFIALLFAELGISDTAGSVNDRCSLAVLLADLRDLARGTGVLADQWTVKRVGADEDEPRAAGEVETTTMPDEAEWRSGVAGL